MVVQPFTPTAIQSIPLTGIVNTAIAPPVRDILDRLADGIMVVTPQRAVQYSNTYAQWINRQFPRASSSTSTIADEIWQVCQAFMETCDRPQTPNPISESILQTQPFPQLRIRVQWLSSEYATDALLLITLEDQQRIAQQAAITEANRYALTPRETEVWLLRQRGCSYQQIAQALYISRNTVKQHLKRIYTKRNAV